MGPKKRKEEEWWQCGMCGRVIHRTDKEKHAVHCEDTPTFLLEGVLHTQLTTAISAPVKDTLGKLPWRCRDNVLLLHPSTMAVCGLPLGQPAVVSGRQVMTLWPCSGLTPTCAYLPRHRVADVAVDSAASHQAPDPRPSSVTVQGFSPSGVEAHRIDIRMETDSEVYHTDVFSQVLASTMEGRYVKQHGRHRARCLGRQCAFFITAIHTLSPPSLPLHLSPPSPSPSPGADAAAADSDLLGSQLAALDLSASGGDNSFCSPPATPVRPTTGETTGAVQQTPEVSPPDDGFHTPAAAVRGPCLVERGFVKVTSRTRFHVQPAGEEETDRASGEERVTFQCLGGLEKQIERIQVHCMAPLLAIKNDASKVPGAVVPSGILLFGPTGTGKSLLARALSTELDIHTAVISPADLYSKYFGETEKKLQSVFREARQRCPSLIIVDHLDALCPRREMASDLEKRTVTTFLSLMDSLTTGAGRETCVVIGLTSKPHDLDPALRRAGRFDLEIETGVPTASDRLQILRSMLCPLPHALTDRELKQLADLTHGYVGADLAAVIREGRRLRWKASGDVGSPLMAQDLTDASKLVAPSAMREVQFEVPQVRWSDIGGQGEVKLKLRQAVEWPLTHPEAFRRLGITPPAGCLLYGPPGCSKTMIAKALATESGLNFLAVKGPELFEKYVGESERAVREIFRKARSAAPSIIFFDEIDSLAVERGSGGGGSGVGERVLTQLLTEMDGVVQLTGVTIVAATNRPDRIDQALLRPGRFDRMLYVPLPDVATRREILEIVGRTTPLAPDVCFQELVDSTHNYSGAELRSVCQEAALLAVTESRQATQVHRRHLEEALKVVLPQTSQESIRFYENYASRRAL